MGVAVPIPSSLPLAYGRLPSQRWRTLLCERVRESMDGGRSGCKERHKRCPSNRPRVPHRGPPDCTAMCLFQVAGSLLAVHRTQETRHKLGPPGPAARKQRGGGGQDAPAGCVHAEDANGIQRIHQPGGEPLAHKELFKIVPKNVYGHRHCSSWSWDAKIGHMRYHIQGQPGGTSKPPKQKRQWQASPADEDERPSTCVRILIKQISIYKRFYDRTANLPLRPTTFFVFLRRRRCSGAPEHTWRG